MTDDAERLAMIRKMCDLNFRMGTVDVAWLIREIDRLRALVLASEGVLVDAPALAVKERQRADKAEARMAELGAAADRMADLLVDIINDPQATVPGRLLARAHLLVKRASAADHAEDA